MIKEQMLLRVPEKLKKELKKKAEQQGISLNALITQILWEHYEYKLNSIISPPFKSIIT